MITDKKVIYSKRYTPADEQLAQIERLMRRMATEQRETVKKTFKGFWQRLEEESVYVAIQGIEEKSRCFIELAKELSRDYQIDIDIKQGDDTIDVSLHMYCAAYPGDMTRLFTRLFNMCDHFCSFILPSEPTDFTLMLSLYTHDHYLSGKLMKF